MPASAWNCSSKPLEARPPSSLDIAIKNVKESQSDARVQDIWVEHSPSVKKESNPKNFLEAVSQKYGNLLSGSTAFELFEEIWIRPDDTWSSIRQLPTRNISRFFPSPEHKYQHEEARECRVPLTLDTSPQQSFNSINSVSGSSVRLDAPIVFRNPFEQPSSEFTVRRGSIPLSPLTMPPLRYTMENGIQLAQSYSGHDIPHVAATGTKQFTGSCEVEWVPTFVGLSSSSIHSGPSGGLQDFPEDKVRGAEHLGSRSILRASPTNGENDTTISHLEVKNVPLSIRRVALLALFGRYGQITWASFQPEKALGEQRSHAKIIFSSVEETQRAHVVLDGYEIEPGKPIQVNIKRFDSPDCREYSWTPLNAPGAPFPKQVGATSTTKATAQASSAASVAVSTKTNEAATDPVPRRVRPLPTAHHISTPQPSGYAGPKIRISNLPPDISVSAISKLLLLHYHGSVFDIERTTTECVVRIPFKWMKKARSVCRKLNGIKVEGKKIKVSVESGNMSAEGKQQHHPNGGQGRQAELLSQKKGVKAEKKGSTSSQSHSEEPLQQPWDAAHAHHTLEEVEELWDKEIEGLTALVKELGETQGIMSSQSRSEEILQQTKDAYAHRSLEEAEELLDREIEELRALVRELGEMADRGEGVGLEWNDGEKGTE